MFNDFSVWWDGLSGLLKVLYCIALPSTLLLIIQTLLAMFGMHNGGMGHDISDTSGISFEGGSLHDVDVSGLHDVGGLHDLGGLHDAGALDLGGHDVGAVHDLSGHDAGLHHGHNIDGGDPGDFTTMHIFTIQTMVTFFTVFSWSSIVLVGSEVPNGIALAVGFVLGVCTMLLVAKLVQMSMRLAENGTLDLRNALGETATVYIPCPPKNQGMGKVNIMLQGQLREVGAFNNGNETLTTGTQVTVVDVRGDEVVVEKDD